MFVRRVVAVKGVFLMRVSVRNASSVPPPPPPARSVNSKQIAGSLGCSSAFVLMILFDFFGENGGSVRC